MRIRYRWLLVTAAAYGLVGGQLLYAGLWDEGSGLAWTESARFRLAWAAGVFLISTWLLARRSPAAPARWLALHAAAAFAVGAAITWGVLEYQMTGSQHPWDTVVGPRLQCIGCPPRVAIIRQTVVAAVLGSIAAAALAPPVARMARRAVQPS